MNTYTLESFISFCDVMQIAEEKGLLGKIGSRHQIMYIRKQTVQFLSEIKK